MSWLTLAVDPWHDTPVTGLEGLPDQGIGKSVSFQVVQEVSISKNTAPVTLPAGNWKVRIGTYPKLTQEYMSTGIFRGDVISTDNTTSGILNSVQISYAPDGTDFSDLGVGGLPGAVQGMNLPLDYTKGVVKVLGIGIEVINTTAPLHKQGLMSCCRMVQPDSEPFVNYLALASPANAWCTKTITPIRTLPKNLSEMALYPGFAQEEAIEGYYAPVLLKFNRPRHYPVPCTTLLLTDDTTAGINYAPPAAGIDCYVSAVTTVTVPGNTTLFHGNRDLPLYYDADSNVVMFTGLSDETTLTARVRYICERFPSDQESQILVMATPSATYDPVALELYSRAVQKLPAGVPFTENPAGEWWQKMIASIADVAAPFLNSFAPGLGSLASAGAHSLAKFDFQPNKKGKRQVDNKNRQMINNSPAIKNQPPAIVGSSSPNVVPMSRRRQNETSLRRNKNTKNVPPQK
jgi:hypothetical protein